MRKVKKVAIVTGASRGIGKSIAIKLSKSGYYVIGTCTNNTIEPFDHVDMMINVDFDDEESTLHFYDEVKNLKSISLLVNNAGINIIKSQTEVHDKDYTRIHNINLKIPYFLSSIVANKMTKIGGGKIVNIASIWSVVTKKNRTLYSTMKSAIHGLTRSMAVEWASSNILINTISPGFINTDLTRNSLSKKEIASIENSIPLNRLANPEEVAELVYFLGSDLNTYLTGQNIIIDGGYTII
jgi:3-oxoacyl-[acyl-carrier protein] reductase